MEFQKLNNQPLVFVLAEFRFSEVLNMGNYLPEIQDILRKKYPYSEIRHGQKVNVLTDGGFEVQQVSEWVFSSEKKDQAVILGINRIVFVPNCRNFLNLHF